MVRLWKVISRNVMLTTKEYHTPLLQEEQVFYSLRAQYVLHHRGHLEQRFHRQVMMNSYHPETHKSSYRRALLQA